MNTTLRDNDASDDVIEMETKDVKADLVGEIAKPSARIDMLSI